MASGKEECNKLLLWTTQLLDAIHASGGSIKFRDAVQTLNMQDRRRIHDVLGVLFSVGYLRQQSRSSPIELGCAQLSNSDERSDQRDDHVAEEARLTEDLERMESHEKMLDAIIEEEHCRIDDLVHSQAAEEYLYLRASDFERSSQLESCHLLAIIASSQAQWTQQKEVYSYSGLHGAGAKKEHRRKVVPTRLVISDPMHPISVVHVDQFSEPAPGHDRGNANISSPLPARVPDTTTGQGKPTPRNTPTRGTPRKRPPSQGPSRSHKGTPQKRRRVEKIVDDTNPYPTVVSRVSSDTPGSSSIPATTTTTTTTQKRKRKRPAASLGSARGVRPAVSPPYNRTATVAVSPRLSPRKGPSRPAHIPLREDSPAQLSSLGNHPDEEEGYYLLSPSRDGAGSVLSPARGIFPMGGGGGGNAVKMPVDASGKSRRLPESPRSPASRSAAHPEAFFEDPLTAGLGWISPAAGDCWAAASPRWPSGEGALWHGHGSEWTMASPGRAAAEMLHSPGSHLGGRNLGLCRGNLSPLRRNMLPPGELRQQEGGLSHGKPNSKQSITSSATWSTVPSFLKGKGASD